MQIKKRQHLLQFKKFARQLLIKPRQHRDKFVKRCRQYADQRGECDQHHHNHNRNGNGALYPPTNKPGDERVENDGKKQRQ
nr:hypothetical protein [Escherichia coli]